MTTTDNNNSLESFLNHIRTYYLAKEHNNILIAYEELIQAKIYLDKLKKNKQKYHNIYKIDQLIEKEKKYLINNQIYITIENENKL